MNRYLLAFATLLALHTLVHSVDAQEVGNEENRFQELMKAIVPAEELRQIEWQSDLLVAQKIALEQKKPIFIWSMDGHPLGCT